MAFKGSLARSVPALVLAAISGCALTIKAPDPARPRHEVPHCDPGKGAVGLDVVVGSMFGLGSIAAFADGEEGTGLALAAAGGLFVASAIRGNTSANACRAAVSEYTLAYRQTMRPGPIVRDRRQPPPVAQRPVEPVLEPAPQIENLEPAPPPPQIPRPETYRTPRPPPAAQKPPPAKPAEPAAPAEDDWSAFWKEAP